MNTKRFLEGDGIRHLALCLVPLCLFVLGAAANAAVTQDSAKDIENRIKAAFIYHFCNYVHWPESAFEDNDSPLVLGVAGPQPVTNAIRSAVGGRLAHGRAINVQRIENSDTLDGIHLLFIDDSEDANSQSLTARAKHNAVLVVTESETGLDIGSAINFVIEDDRVRFDIAPDIVRQHQLVVSAQLLTVARRVHRGLD